MASSTTPVLAIDGPSGTGKGTVADMLAKEFGWHMLDSGALYRVVAIGAEQRNISYCNINHLSDFAAAMDVSFSTLFSGSIVLEGEEISALVRLEESGAKASVIAAIGEVRQALLQRQLAFRQAPGLVADGRDMGSVVFPDAFLKIFLTASAEVRAQRRYKQLINKGLSVNLRDLLLKIKERDERDSMRAVAPMVAAEDALIVNTDALNANEVYAFVKQEALSRLQTK